jgi:hypothetical protein
VPQLFFFEFPATLQCKANPQEVVFTAQNAVKAHNSKFNHRLLFNSFVFWFRPQPQNRPLPLVAEFAQEFNLSMDRVEVKQLLTLA